MLRFIPASAGNGTVIGIPEWLKTDDPLEVIESAHAQSDLFELWRTLMKDWWRYVDQGSGDDPEPVEQRVLWILLEVWNARSARSVRYRLMGGFPVPPWT